MALPLVGVQTAHARSYPPSPSPTYYPPRPEPGETQYPDGHPRPDDRDGLADTGADSETVMLVGGSAVALIAAGGGAVWAVRRRRAH